MLNYTKSDSTMKVSSPENNTKTVDDGIALKSDDKDLDQKLAARPTQPKTVDKTATPSRSSSNGLLASGSFAQGPTLARAPSNDGTLHIP